MIAIEPTRDVVSEVYGRLDKNLSTVRSVQNRPLTLADKILLSHLDDPTTTGMVRGQTYVQLRPDRVILQDVLGQTAMLQFMQTLPQLPPQCRPRSTATTSSRPGWKAAATLQESLGENERGL